MDATWGIVIWELMAVAAIIWLIRVRKKSKRRAAITQAPTKGEAFRRWVEYDGSRDGLQHWLNVWRDKPWAPKPPKDAEWLNAAERAAKAFTENQAEIEARIGRPLNIFDLVQQTIVEASKEKTAEKEPDSIDKLAGAGDDAILRFFQKNKEQIRKAIFKGRTSGVATIDLPKYQKGQWLRICGELSIVEDIVGTEVWYRTFYGQHIEPIVSDRIKPAMPRKGEWWKCVEPGCGEPMPWKSENDVRPLGGEHSLEPVNFGRGITSGIMRTTSDGPREFATPRFKAGDWVRYTRDFSEADVKWPEKGRLGKVMVSNCVRPGGVAVLIDDDLVLESWEDHFEPAFPRKNEWWRCVSCTCCTLRTPWVALSNYGPVEVDGRTIEPVNFGRGEEAKG